MRSNDEIHDAIIDVKYEVLGLREDFVDLKAHVNDQHEAYTALLAQKADRRDLTLAVLWRQSPKWMKLVGAIVTAAVAVSAAVGERLPLPF